MKKKTPTCRTDPAKPHPNFIFPKQTQEHQSTISLNQGALITDRRSFDAYTWPNPESADYAILDTLAQDLPDGMRFIVPGPGGVLENAVAIVGYERLCLLLADDRKLVEDVFENIGVRLIAPYLRNVRLNDSNNLTLTTS